MRARLLGLVLIPSIGLGLVAADQLGDQRHLASEAEALVADVDRAAVTLDAFVNTTQEYRLAEIIVQAGKYGVSREVAADLLQLDLVGDMAAARARVDANARVPTFLEELGYSKADLETARARLDRTGQSAPIFADVVIAAENAWIADVSSMVDEDARVPLEAELRRALLAFQTSADLYRMANEELLLVSETVAPGSAVRDVDADNINVAAARYEVALQRAAADADEHVAPTLQAIIEDRSFADVLQELGVNDGATVDVVGLAEIFRPGLARDSQLQVFTEVTAEDARVHAASVGDAARSRYRRTTAIVIGLVLGTVVLALVVARSIAGPLRLLARRAAEVSDGELDGPPLRSAGPRETAVLARTLNDAVENLRAVEGQMSALASGDVLAASRATPGKLGALVGRSVDGLARSIAERERLQQRLAHDAAHDALTGLANRRTAMAAIDELLRDERHVALLFLDLDGFKLVNDEQGHAVGDVLLTVAADRLRRVAPDDALVARLGGDEFVVCVAVTAEHEATDLGMELAEVLDRQVHIDGLPHRIAVSIGVAVSRPGDDAERLLRSADAALYEAKRNARGTAVALDHELRAHLEAQHRLEADLRVALAEDQLVVHYQPIFEATGELHGVEALVRWRREDGTMVPPDDFIPTAERSGLIVDLDRWVLRRALRHISAWRRGPFPGLRLSVNVSARTLLSSRLVTDVGEALHDAAVEGTALVLEVTETALLHDLDTAAERIDQLRDLGVGTSVDDFGSGYTSVAHLRRLPVTEIKIDRSFVHAMEIDERELMLVDLVARIGNVLSLDVVAEGVETQEQLDALRLLGCRFAQGYLLGRPMSPREFEVAHRVIPSVRALT